MKMANMDDYFDVVIVGTGAAGLYCALNLPARYRILLLTKQKADESDSFLAQGGICMQHGEADYRPFFDAGRPLREQPRHSRPDDSFLQLDHPGSGAPRRPLCAG